MTEQLLTAAPEVKEVVVEPNAVTTPEVLTPATDASDWRAGIKDEKLRTSKSISTVKDLDALVKGYDEAQRYIGGAVKVPAADAPQEEWDKFHAKLGRPESPDKYEIKTPKVTVDGSELQVNEGQMSGFKSTAHKLGLTPQQAQGVVDYYAGMIQQGREAIGPSMKDAREALKQEWGGAFDRNLSLAQRAAKEVGGEELIKMLDASGLGNHPAMVKLMAKVGQILSEDGVIVGDVPGVMNPQGAQMKITEIMNNKDHPYHSSRTAGHAEAVAEVERLFQLAYSAA